MVPLGVLNQDIEEGDPSILLDLPFATDMLDKSMYRVPMRLYASEESYLPVLQDGALFFPQLTGISAIATGRNDLSVFEHLNLKNKKFTIEYETKPMYGSNAAVFFMSNSLFNVTYVGGSAGSVHVSHSSSFGRTIGGVYNYRYDVMLDGRLNYIAPGYTKVKLVRTGATSYQLYLNDVLIDNDTAMSPTMFLDTGDVGKGVILTSSYASSCYIKNVKIISNGDIV